jgi:hypothetical protein
MLLSIFKFSVYALYAAFSFAKRKCTHKFEWAPLVTIGHLTLNMA